MNSNVIVLDCDGVLKNYHSSYPKVWKKAFGEDLPVVNQKSYFAHKMYGLDFDYHHIGGNNDIANKFFEAFGPDIWEDMDPLPGAIDACNRLVDAGFELVCVSSMPNDNEIVKARLRGFKKHGFPIDRLVSTGGKLGFNPKVDTIIELNPIAFVDDLCSNFLGIPDTIHKALIHLDHDDSPNIRYLDIATTQHENLTEFVEVYLSRHT